MGRLHAAASIAPVTCSAALTHVGASGPGCWARMWVGSAGTVPARRVRDNNGAHVSIPYNFLPPISSSYELQNK
jgi:hypothetical protein